MKVIYKKSKHIIYSVIPVVFLALVSTLTIFPNSPTHAETFNYNVQIRPSLNITVSSSTVQLVLNPSTTPFGKADLNVSVGTNNPNGYKLYIGSESDQLENHTYSTPTYIDTLSSSTTETTFPANSWGYRISSLSSGNVADDNITDTTGTNFYKFTSGAMIGSSTTSVNNNTTTLTFGSKVNYEKPAGVYTLDFNFKTLPVISTYTLQDLATNHPTECTEDPMIVTDSRDGQSYAVAKLEDDNCWMLQNLKLGKLSDNIALTTADSAVPAAGFTLSSNEAGAQGKFPYVTRTDDTRVGTGTNVYVKDKSEFYCTNDYGCYYNFYTATAGSGLGEAAESDWKTDKTVDYSICPKGWNLPTGDSGGQFKALSTAYGGTGAAASAALLVSNPTTAKENINGSATPGLLLSGSYDGGGAHDLGVGGLYWSRTSYSIGRGYLLSISTSGVNPLHRRDKHNGFAVRCLFTPPSN